MRAKRVLLSVTGVSQNVGESNDTTHLVTTGLLSGENDSWRLRYSETQPENNETHRVTFTMGGGVVTMQREGDYNTNMIFKQGHRFEGSYETPYGALEMGLFPTHVRYDVDGEKGEVVLKYQLDIQGHFASMREMRIRFVPRKHA